MNYAREDGALLLAQMHKNAQLKRITQVHNLSAQQSTTFSVASHQYWRFMIDRRLFKKHKGVLQNDDE